VGTGENKVREFSSQQRKASPGADNSEKACMCHFEESRRAAAPPGDAVLGRLARVDMAGGQGMRMPSDIPAKKLSISDLHIDY
jgi:hypothetical protein